GEGGQLDAVAAEAALEMRGSRNVEADSQVSAPLQVLIRFQKPVTSSLGPLATVHWTGTTDEITIATIRRIIRYPAARESAHAPARPRVPHYSPTCTCPVSPLRPPGQAAAEGPGRPAARRRL